MWVNRINGEGSVILQTNVGINGQRYINLGNNEVYRILSWQGFAEIGYLAREYGEPVQNENSQVA